MTNDAIVLVTGDAGVRSALAAGLGLAGLTLMIVDSCNGPRIGEYLRRADILILDDDLRTETRPVWIARLLQLSQTTRIILLADGTVADVPPEVICVPKRRAVRSILALIELWSSLAS